MFVCEDGEKPEMYPLRYIEDFPPASQADSDGRSDRSLPQRSTGPKGGTEFRTTNFVVDYEVLHPYLLIKSTFLEQPSMKMLMIKSLRGQVDAGNPRDSFQEFAH
jgi:hypothetical protein